jgi:hypothetical protein
MLVKIQECVIQKTHLGRRLINLLQVGELLQLGLDGGRVDRRRVRLDAHHADEAIALRGGGGGGGFALLDWAGSIACDVEEKNEMFSIGSSRRGRRFATHFENQQRQNSGKMQASDGKRTHHGLHRDEAQHDHDR